MNKVFTDNGWKDYVYWKTEDRKTLKKKWQRRHWKAGTVNRKFSRILEQTDQR